MTNLPTGGDDDGRRRRDENADGARDAFGTDDDRTPTERPPRRPASDVALRLARAAAIEAAFSVELARAGGVVDRLAPDERPLYLRRVIAAVRKNQLGLAGLMDDIEADIG
jgi:hypothetical protein